MTFDFFEWWCSRDPEVLFKMIILDYFYSYQVTLNSLVYLEFSKSTPKN